MLQRASSAPQLPPRLASVDDERARRLALQNECARLDREGQVIAAQLAATRSAIFAAATQAAATPAPARRLPRQPTAHVELELRVVGGAWDGHEPGPSETSGVVRCHRDDSLHDIRILAAQQLPWLTQGFIFVRWTEEGRLCKLADEALTQHADTSLAASQFRARHFVPPEGGVGLLHAVYGRVYYEDERLTEEETKTTEFKSLAEPWRRRGMSTLEVLRERKIDPPAEAPGQSQGQGYTLLEKYMCGFLNSVGGRILFGIDDASRVEMVPLYAEATGNAAGHHDEVPGITNEAKDAVRKLVDATALHLSPPIDSSLYDVAFIPVVSRDDRASEGIGDHSTDVDATQLLLAPSTPQRCFVVEVTVQQPGERDRACYFPNESTWCTWQRKTTSTMIQTEQWARAHLTPKNRGWRTVENGGSTGGSNPTLDQSFFLGERAEHFVGRQWFYDHIHRLLCAQKQRRFNPTGDSPTVAVEESAGSCSSGVAVCAGEGYGKTALVGNLLRFGGRNNRFVCSKGRRLCVLGYHCCQASDPRSLNPSEFIRSLAVQLSVGYRVPCSLRKGNEKSKNGSGNGEDDIQSRRRLESKAVGNYYSTVLINDPAIQTALAGDDPEVALEEGILAPLRAFHTADLSNTAAAAMPCVPCVIIIDSIDEGVSQRHSQQRKQTADCGSLLPQQQGRGRWQGDRHVFRPQAGDFPALAKATSPTSEATPVLGPSATDGQLSHSMTIPELLLRALQSGRVPSFLQLVVTVRQDGHSIDEDDDDVCGTASRPSLVPQGAFTTDGCVTALLSHLQSARLDEDSDSPSVREYDSGGTADATRSVANTGEQCSLPIWWEDVATYCRNAVAVGFVGTESESGYSPRAMEHLCDLSCGNFLYVSTVLEDIRKRRITWDTVLHELQPGLKYLLNRHLNAARLDANPALLLAVEVIMAATQGNLGLGCDYYGMSADGGGGVTSAIIVESVRTMLCETVAASLSVGRIERLLRTIPKRLLTCRREEKLHEQRRDGGDRVDDDGDHGLSTPQYRWRLSHESVQRWLKGLDGGNADALQLSVSRGHRMLAARLAYRLATVPIRTSLAQWLVKEQRPETFSRLTCIDPAEIVQLAVHISAATATIQTPIQPPTAHAGDNSGLPVLATLGSRILTIKRTDTAQTALHICAVVSVQDEDAMARATQLLLDALRTKAGHASRQPAKGGQAPGVMTAFLNARDMQGQTALHLACRDGHTALASVLLSAGADPGICDDGFNTAVSAAAGNGRHSTLRLLALDPATLHTRRRVWSVLDVRDHTYGLTPLQLARSREDYTSEAILVEAHSAAQADSVARHEAAKQRHARNGRFRGRSQARDVSGRGRGRGRRASAAYHYNHQQSRKGG